MKNNKLDVILIDIREFFDHIMGTLAMQYILLLAF